MIYIVYTFILYIYCVLYIMILFIIKHNIPDIFCILQNIIYLLYKNHILKFLDYVNIIYYQILYIYMK